jgi:hypothetical protein
MGLFYILLLQTFAAGFFGMCALTYAAGYKLSTESIDSPKLTTRWIYRYLIFSFYFVLSFLSLGPLTTWQLIKIPDVQSFASDNSWLLFALNIPPTALLYYLHRKFVIWCDPMKIRGRKRLREKLASRTGC